MSPEPAATGTLAEEAALLLDAVAHRLITLRSDSGGAAADAARCPECGSVPGASCTACPV